MESSRLFLSSTVKAGVWQQGSRQVCSLILACSCLNFESFLGADVDTRTVTCAGVHPFRLFCEAQIHNWDYPSTAITREARSKQSCKEDAIAAEREL